MASSVTRAATPAASPAVDPVDLVNAEAGYPAQEIYPGAVDPAQYGPGSGPRPPGSPEGPAYGTWGDEPFTATLPAQAPGGGYQDTAWMSGHDAPMVPWDSSAGEPFAPSGALNPDLHAQDTGGVYVREHVTPAEIGTLTRATAMGQTTVTIGETQTEKVSVAPNGRSNLDQQQWHNPDGYDPWTIPYSERPIHNNLAWENVPTSASEAPYGVSGALPDRAPYDYAAMAYEAPADPAVATVGAAGPMGGSGIGGGWV